MNEPDDFEPERDYQEPPMGRFFTDAELQEMWLECQDPIEPKEPETFAEAVLRCLGSYRAL